MLPVDHNDVVSGLNQIPGTGYTDDTGTKDGNFHLLELVWMQLDTR